MSSRMDGSTIISPRSTVTADTSGQHGADILPVHREVTSAAALLIAEPSVSVGYSRETWNSPGAATDTSAR